VLIARDDKAVISQQLSIGFAVAVGDQYLAASWDEVERAQLKAVGWRVGGEVEGWVGDWDWGLGWGLVEGGAALRGVSKESQHTY